MILTFPPNDTEPQTPNPKPVASHDPDFPSQPLLPTLLLSSEVIEEIVKTQLEQEKCPPGKYYPFMSGKIKPESPLGKLLDSKGVKY